MLSRDVRAKDLGLLIVDEEQRFGVKQKELLRQLKLKVDVISMSATPIPRTLQMSLAGLRDISVIETPPEGRRPVRDLRGRVRGGARQARDRARAASAAGRRSSCTTAWSSIEETAERLRALCPGVRFAVAHGQMAEGELEAVMMDYLRGGADVLVCTSIIESGIDIPQANTLIVEHADTLRPGPALPDPRARGTQPRARLRLPALRLRGRADRRGGPAPVGAVGLHRAGRGLQDRDARPGDPRRRATCSATSSPGTWRRSASSSTCRCSTRRSARPGPSRRARACAEPVRLDVNVDAYVPADYVPYEQAKIEVHRRVAGGARGGRRGAAARGARGPLRAGARAAARTCSRCSARASSSARPARGR